MLLYKCFLTGEEMFTDSYPVKDFNDLIFEVKAKHTTQKADKLDGALFGANASQEEEAEEVCDSDAKSGLDVALAHEYTETGFPSKKDFLKSMVDYLKKIIKKKEENGDQFDVTAFKEAHQATLKKDLAPIYTDLQFFMGSGQDCDATLAMLHWRKDGDSDEETPYFYFFKSGIKVEKS